MKHHTPEEIRAMPLEQRLAIARSIAQSAAWYALASMLCSLGATIIGLILTR